MHLTDLLILMPLLILAGGALVVLLLGAFVPGRYGSALGIAACAGAAIWALQAPPAILSPTLGLAATPFARFFTIFFSLTAATVLVLSHAYTEQRGIEGEEYPATVLFVAFGAAALSASVNLLTLFLGLEALTFGFYVLVAMELRRAASAEAGIKYLLLGAVAAAFLAFGIALIYCGTGTLQIAGAMAASTTGAGRNVLALAGWGLLLTGLAFKASLVPAHLWTPDVYQGAPTPVSAYLASASKGGAVVAFLLLLPGLPDAAFLRPPLWGLALLSMVVGNLAALRQTDLKRLLAYSSIAQMGYVTLALLSGTAGGYRAAAFYILIYAAMTLAAFGALCVLDDGSGGPESISALRGLGFRRPLAGAVLALAMFALTGIPPTAGFTGKFLIFSAALKAGEYALAVIGILTSAVSAYYYLRVVVLLYMEQPETPSPQAPRMIPLATVLTGLAGTLLALGLQPALLLRWVAIILP